MDWAQGIEVVGGELVARVADAAGMQELVKLSDLGTRGLPTATSTLRLIERVDLSELHPTDSTEYLEVFGLQGAAGENAGHAVYQLLTERRRWLIPALALIRGVFRPHNVLLDEVFRPHMLERVSYFDPTDGRVVITAPWAKKVGNSATDPSALLAWLWRDTAAGRLAGGVHRQAMSGAIAVDPTGAKVDIAVKGTKIGNTFYVTRCTVTRAYLPTDHVGASADEEVVDFFGPVLKRGGPGSTLKETLDVVQERHDGGLEVTDAEWEALLPILRSDIRGKKPKVDVRQVWNLLLHTMTRAGGSTKVDMGSALGRSLVWYRKKWREQRSLQKALDVLNGMRGAG